MKKLIFPFLALLLLISGPVVAQNTAADNALDYSAVEKHPAQTSPNYVAMVFYKLTGKQPNFDAWVRATQDYQDAAPTQKGDVREKMLANLRSSYNLLTLQEPIILEIPVKLSPYSDTNKGFFVESFKPETFLPVTFNDLSFAIVPQDLMDKQWVGISDPQAAQAISAAASTAANGKPLTMLLMLAPKYADGSSEAQLDGGKYWLISAEIKKMMLFGPDPAAGPLWQTADTAVDNAKRQELLNLRQ